VSQVQAIPAPVLPAESRPFVVTAPAATAIPWTIWFVTAGICCAFIGGTWDISWHMSIGRETFWTPAHLLIQTEAVLVGIAVIYTILTTTFGSDSAAREASVEILGLHAPAGTFIAAWGCISMLTSAPLDNWWHDAYGLDVKIVSPPPHMMLMLGSLANKFGAMAWMAGLMNRSQGILQRRLVWPLALVGSICVAQLQIMIMSPTWIWNMHTATCYLAVALVMPLMMIATGWGSSHKWGCTIVGLMCTVLTVGPLWLLPFFPAHPKLGPVYHNVTHMVPLRFPLLLIVPAIVTDLLLQRLPQRSYWLKALWIGPAFVLSFMAVQWPFANFLMSPASRNWFFGTQYFGYADPAQFLYDPYQFHVVEKTPLIFMLTMVGALVASVMTTRMGLAWGNWMRRIRR